MLFWDIYEKKCKEIGKSASFVALELGFSKNACYQWKKGSSPNLKTLPRFAEYFNCSVSDFTENTQNIAPVSNVYKIPVFESVSAGFGAYADSIAIDYINIECHSQSDADNTICIKVVGDSMYPNIQNGDIITVKKCDDVNNGDVVVALIGDEGYVKRILLKNDEICLESFNPMYPPMIFKGESCENVKIVGRVKSVTRNL